MIVGPNDPMPPISAFPKEVRELWISTFRLIAKRKLESERKQKEEQTHVESNRITENSVVTSGLGNFAEAPKGNK